MSKASAIRLGDFQDAFTAALRGAASDETLAAIVAQPGFAVYRNTVMAGCLDALQANYPTVNRLVGEAWFRGAAHRFAHDHPPRRPSLAAYGAGFPDFLAHFGPAAEVPYLADVARLDWDWCEAHIAADGPPLSAAAVADLNTEQLARTVLLPHPAARWRWFPAAPIHSIWRANRDEAAPSPPLELDWHGEGALVVRPDDVVRSVALDAAGCAFLDACHADQPLAAAALAALNRDPRADLAALLAQLLRAGAFTAMRVDTAHGAHPTSATDINNSHSQDTP